MNDKEKDLLATVNKLNSMLYGVKEELGIQYGE